MPRDAVSRTAHVGTLLQKRNGRKKWVNTFFVHMNIVGAKIVAPLTCIRELSFQSRHLCFLPFKYNLSFLQQQKNTFHIKIL